MTKQRGTTLALALALLSAGCTAEQNQPPDTSADTGEPGTTGDAPTTGDDPCAGENGCWQCEVETPAQLINACSDATCEPFANTRERLPLLGEDGELPPLP